jgi:ADP-ribosyl-[dinitrogen reductase] hydrolase
MGWQRFRTCCSTAGAAKRSTVRLVPAGLQRDLLVGLTVELHGDVIAHENLRGSRTQWTRSRAVYSQPHVGNQGEPERGCSMCGAESHQDRARGALLGLAAGDAVGTTVEFKRPGSFEPVTDMVGGGPFGLEPGQWTDDTSMALCLAESLVESGGHDPADQMRRYLRWWREGYFSSTGKCFDIGTTTSSQLARFERTGEPHDPDADEESAANGSLMRLAPVAIRWSHDPAAVVEQAAASSRTTHAARRPVDACKLLAAMTAALIRGQPADEVFHPVFWRQGELHEAVAAVARGSWQGKEPPAIRGTGYSVAALEAAIWAVAGARDFRDAILRATNLGDDADTTAAIAGQLAGARHGASGIPPEWLSKLAMRARSESLADALHRAAVGQRLLWEDDEYFHGWWADAEGRVLGGEYPGDWDDGETELLKLQRLVEAGIGTIIDLTDERDWLTPYEKHLRTIEARHGVAIERLSHPIPDQGVTSPAHYDRIIADLEWALAAGRKVFVHCVGGRGRTGTVIGIWHVHRGHSVEAALARIAAAREGTRKQGLPSPETEEQVDAIREAHERRRL